MLNSIFVALIVFILNIYHKLHWTLVFLKFNYFAKQNI